jgi:hypothetical protein
MGRGPFPWANDAVRKVQVRLWAGYSSGIELGKGCRQFRSYREAARIERLNTTYASEQAMVDHD